MCLVCNDEKIIWKTKGAGELTVAPCPNCKKSGSNTKEEFRKLRKQIEVNLRGVSA